MAGRGGAKESFLITLEAGLRGGPTIEGTHLGLSLEEAHFGHGLVRLPVYTLEERK